MNRELRWKGGLASINFFCLRISFYLKHRESRKFLLECVEYGCFFWHVFADTCMYNVKIGHEVIARHQIVVSAYIPMKTVVLIFVMERWTVRIVFCQWLAQTWLVILTRTQLVSQWEEMYGSWLKLIANASSLTEWYTRATVSCFWVCSSNCRRFPGGCTTGVNFSELFLFCSDRIITCNLLSLGIIEWLDYWSFLSQLWVN